MKHTLRLYNTLTRKIEDFKPIKPPQVGIYTCGPTVYREVHIGNFRTYLLSDFLRRTLEYNGFRVTHIKNITDVGHMRDVGHGHHAVQIDPIIKEALDQGKPPLEIARSYTSLFWDDEKKLNILKATEYPKATEHIKEMIKMISILLKKGLAYESNGTIYFDVKEFRDYGRLSGNTLDKMDKLLKAVRISVETDKKDSVDFALWKRAEKGRLMKWDSPWPASQRGEGNGFPGWHIECSAMSTKYLGDTIDIHTGGEDLIFPHHEDEIAQSEGVSGKKFVNYWLHGGYLLVDNEKMSRSKGNVYTISDLEKRNFDPLSFRYLTMMTHYKAKMNFTFDALEAAQTALNRLREEAADWEEPEIGCAEYEQRFMSAINNDLNMPEAMGVVWELIRSDYPSSAKAESLFRFDKVLGLNLAGVKSSTLRLRSGQELKVKSLEIPQEIRKLIKEREELRKQKRYDLGDELRSKIKKMGYSVQDTKKGVKIKKT